MFHDSLIPMAAFDRGYLDKVKGGFNETGLTMEMLFYIVTVLVAVLALYLFGRGLNVMLSRCGTRGIPDNWIVKKPQIMELFHKALDSRSKFEMKFTPADFSRRATMCSLLEITSGSLVLELDMNVKATKRWLGRSVEIFFKLQGSKKNLHFYHFNSEVSGIKRTPQGESILLLAFPDKLELQQKRSFLRLEPPSQYFLGCAVWLASSVRNASEVKSWPRPLLLNQPGKTGNKIMISDISAGGMRILIKRDVIRSLNLDITISNRLYAALDLYDPEIERKRRYWVLCNVQHLYEDYESKDTEYGLQFISWGRPKKEEDMVSLEWKLVENDGIEPLGSWVMKRHLEIYRDKGIA